MKKPIHITYRDLKQDGYDNEYEIVTPNEIDTDEKLMMIKEQIIKGKFGYPDMYIRYLSVTYQRKIIPIFSYTDYELTIAKRIEILAQSVSLSMDN